MGLYLCVFDGDEELEGVDIGSYADFEFFRHNVRQFLEDGMTGKVYPTLMLHSDSDGEWTPAECELLKRELQDIETKFKDLPAIEYPAPWQRQVAKSLGLKPDRLCDAFIDVDGEPLLERIKQLCDVALQSGQPILFQ